MIQQKKLLISSADIILLAAGIICLLALFYFVYYYSWTGQRQFTTWRAVVFYYFFPLALAASFFACLRLRRPRKIELALLLCSAGLSIYALEILVTVWFSLEFVIQDLNRKQRVESARALGVAFDSRTKRQVIDDLRKQGIDAVPSFGGPLINAQNDGTMKSLITINGTQVLPLSGPSHRIIVVCNEGGKFLTYRSDERGFNNPEGLWSRRPVDVVAVGDSFVQGWCVPPNRNFVSLIRNHKPVTLNLGLEGEGPLVEFATIKEYAQVVKPKAVLWFYFEGNDIKDLDNESKSPLLMRYLTNGFRQDLWARQVEIDRALDGFIKEALLRSRASMMAEDVERTVKRLLQMPTTKIELIMLKQLRQRLGLIYGEQADKDFSNRSGTIRPVPAQIELLGTIMANAKDLVASWGGRLYFVYLPAWDRYVGEGNPDRDAVLQMADRVGLSVIDIHQSFMKQEDPVSLFPFRLASHYNETGHRLVADAVLHALAKGK